MAAIGLTEMTEETMNTIIGIVEALKESLDDIIPLLKVQTYAKINITQGIMWI